MDQVPTKNLQVRGYYDHERLQLMKDKSGLTDLDIALRAKVSPTTVAKALRGAAKTFRVVADISLVIGGDYKDLFPNVKLPKPRSQYHRAIRQEANEADSAVVDRSSMGDRGRSKSSVRTKSKAAA